MSFPEIKTRSAELWRICAPITVEQAGVTLMGLVSVWLVNYVGEYAVTAVGMVDSISMFVLGLFAAMTTGGTIVVSRLIASNRPTRAASASGQAILLAAGFGAALMCLLFIIQTPMLKALFGSADESVMRAARTFFNLTLISYPIAAVFQTVFGCLRGGGNTRAPMFISISMNVVNLVLGILFVRGAHVGSLVLHPMGVAGVAWALLVSRLWGFIASVYYIWRLNPAFTVSFKRDFRLNMFFQRSILGIGAPTSVESSLFNLGKLLTMTYIVAMGKEAATANSIGGSLMGFVNIPGNAISVGVLIIIGTRIGAGRADDVKRSAVFCIIASSVFMGVICLLCYIFNGAIVSAYHLSANTARTLAALMLLYYAATPVFWSASFVSPGILRACGDTRFTMIVAIISMWAVRIVLGYVLGVTLRMGIMGVWLAMVTDWVLRGVFFMIRIIGGGWRKRVGKHAYR